MFFNKKKKQEQEQKARLQAAVSELRHSIEKAQLLFDRCSTYEFEVSYPKLEAVLAAFPADKYELKIEKSRNCYGWESIRYFIVKKNKEDNE